MSTATRFVVVQKSKDRRQLFQTSAKMAVSQNSEHFTEIFANFNMMRRYFDFLCTLDTLSKLSCIQFNSDQSFCDVIFVTMDQKEFPVHKVVLASCSPYFKALFNRFEESNQKRIVLKNVDSKTLSLLLDYVYSSKIKVDEENVQVKNSFLNSNHIRP